MKFAILRGIDFLRFESDDTGALEPGATRHPVVVDPKPEHDPAVHCLLSQPIGLDAPGAVHIGWTVHHKRPRPAPGGVIVQQADTSALEAQIAALREALAGMTAKPALDMDTTVLAALASNALEGNVEARARLGPIAAARGVSVDALITQAIEAQKAATEQALERMRGAG